jgi:hypothetical protein
MAREIPTIPFDEFAADISGVFDRVAREHEAIVVEKANGERVVLRPARPPKRRRRRISAADYQAFLESAGGWKGLVDGEALKRNIRQSRDLPPRPPVEL